MEMWLITGQTPDDVMLSSMETPKAVEARLPALGERYRYHA